MGASYFYKPIRIHGLQYRAAAIQYQLKNNTLSFVVADEGPGFDYYNLPDPTAPVRAMKPTRLLMP